MNSNPPEPRRPRVAFSPDESPARRRDLAHLARRIVAAPPGSARALSAYLVLLRAVEIR